MKIYGSKQKEDKTMKNLRIVKLKNFSLAALLMAGAAFTACSSSDDITTETPQPVNPTGKYTMTIQASKGDGATTRALSSDGSGGLNATWAEGEQVLVFQNGSPIGALTAAASATAETTLSGTLDSAPDPDEALTFHFHSADIPSYDGQDGTLTMIALAYDFCEAATVASDDFTVDDVNNTVTVDDGITFGANKQAIVKFTFKDKADVSGNTKLSPSKITASLDVSPSADERTKAAIQLGATSAGITFPYESEITIPATTYTENGEGVIYLAIPDKLEAMPRYKSSFDFTLTATVGSETYKLTKSGFPFENGNYYEITAKMTKQEVHIVNSTSGVEVAKVNGTYSLTDGESYTMSGIGSGNIEGNNVTLTIEDGTVLTGTMSTPASGQNNASIVLNGDFTLNGSFANYFAQGSDLHNYDAGYATITSGDGNYHTFNVNGSLAYAHIYLAEHVTIRHNGELPDTYGYVKNADGSADITPSEETIGGVTYNVYVGSSGCGVVTVWINSWFSDDCYVVFYNDEAHVTLTDTGKTYENDYGQLLKCYTATLTAGATTYTVYDSSNNALASNVPVSDGDIVIYSTGGSSWLKKYW